MNERGKRMNEETYNVVAAEYGEVGAPTVHTGVKSVHDLWVTVDETALAVDAAADAYLRSRESDATEEERFNEGRHGRTLLAAVDAAQAALTQLRMRVNLQVEGRENARAAQLDRILHLVEGGEHDDA